MKKICVVCSTQFETDVACTKYCSKECKRHATNKRERLNYKKNKRYVKKKCVDCGKTFKTSTVFVRCNPCIESNRRNPTVPQDWVRNCFVCGSEFTTRIRHKITCSDICKNERYKKQHSKSVNKIKKALNKETNGMTTVDAICPGCLKHHKKKVLISSVGIVTPRYFCPDFPSCIQKEHIYYERSFYDSWQSENRGVI